MYLESFCFVFAERYIRGTNQFITECMNQEITFFKK